MLEMTIDEIKDMEEINMVLENRTGSHLIGIRLADGCIYNIPYSGSTARINFEQIEVGEIDGISIYRNGHGEVKGLPDVCEGTVYIVSRLVAEYVKRPDVVCPNTAPGHVLRDEYGLPVAVDSFITYG